MRLIIQHLNRGISYATDCCLLHQPLLSDGMRSNAAMSGKPSLVRAAPPGSEKIACALEEGRCSQAPRRSSLALYFCECDYLTPLAMARSSPTRKRSRRGSAVASSAGRAGDHVAREEALLLVRMRLTQGGPAPGFSGRPATTRRQPCPVTPCAAAAPLGGGKGRGGWRGEEEFSRTGGAGTTRVVDRAAHWLTHP